MDQDSQLIQHVGGHPSQRSEPLQPWPVVTCGCGVAHVIPAAAKDSWAGFGIIPSPKPQAPSRALSNAPQYHPTFPAPSLVVSRKERMTHFPSSPRALLSIPRKPKKAGKAIGLAHPAQIFVSAVFYFTSHTLLSYHCCSSLVRLARQV